MAKQQLSELKISTDFVFYVTQESKKAWPTIYRSFKDIYKDKFTVMDEMMAPYDLSLAAVAENLQSVRNIFPKAQAERIEKWIKQCIDIKNYGEYALAEVKKYDEMFNKTINDTMTNSGEFQGMNPLDTLAVCLLHRWLGANIRKFEVELNGKKTGVIDPILIEMITSMLISLVIQWKKLKEDFEIVEENLPMGDIIPAELRDFIPEKIDDVSRGTRVLVKGPWEGIKEAHFELPDESIKKFADEKGIVYASCSFEKGKPKYTLMNKKLWERMDELEKILMNKDLSQEQQQEAIQKLAK